MTHLGPQIKTAVSFLVYKLHLQFNKACILKSDLLKQIAIHNEQFLDTI